MQESSLSNVTETTPRRSGSTSIDYGYNVDASPTKKTDHSNHSLASILASGRRASFHQLQQQFALDYSLAQPDVDTSRRKRRSVNFAEEHIPELQEPATKRRRFQRRNSKTAAMLFRTITEHREEIEQEAEKPEEQDHSLSSYLEDDVDTWANNDGLEIAEDIVRHLARRQNSSNTGY